MQTLFDFFEIFYKNMPEKCYKTNFNKKVNNFVDNFFLDKKQYTSCLGPKNCRRSSNLKIATNTIAAWHF